MPKVLVIATSHNTRGGITSVIKAHQQGRQWNEYKCEWIATHIDGTPCQKIWYFIKGILRFIIKLPKVDLIHIHMAAVERKMPFVFIAYALRKKIIIHLHFPDPQTTIYNPKKAWKYRWCLNKANRVIALSNSWKELLEKEWDIKNIEVIYNPCPTISPTPNYIVTSNTPYILYAGNLSIRKGYRDLIEAFARVKDKMPNWKIKLAGNGELDNARKLARKLGIENHIEFLGWVDGEKKDQAFRNASAYCLPSYAEGFPMGVLDAWAYHLPVITTPVGGLPEILENNKNALTFTPGNIAGLSECLLKITDTNIRQTLSHAAANLSQGKFNISTINNQLNSLYYQLLS